MARLVLASFRTAARRLWLPARGRLAIGVLACLILRTELVFADNCGISCLLEVCHLVGVDLPEDQQEQLAGMFPSAQCSMLDIKRAGEQVSVSMVGVEASMDELLDDGIRGPSIIHLTAPDHFLVLLRGSSEWVQCVDAGRVIVGPRTEVEKRYSGHALILDQSQFAEGGPRLEVPEFHHTFGIAGVGQAVEHAFTVRNVGDQDLVVHPQKKTCCGAPKVTIGQEELAPGESTQVTVSFTITYSGSVMKSAELPVWSAANSPTRAGGTQ